MTIATINAIAQLLSGVKINKIEDKDAKAALLKDYIALRRVVKDADEAKNELIRKFQEDWAEVLPAVQAFRDKNEAVVGYDDYLEAEKDANKAIQDIYAEDVDIDLSPVKMEAIMDFSEDITLEQIAFLQECGLVE